VSVERISVESKKELEQMITNEINQIEKNLTVICTQVPINDKMTIDALCHDENGQLVILQVNVNEDDTALLHGIQSLDYVDKFKSFLKMTYSKHKIDDKEKPRLILVAPNFSETLRHIVQNIQGLRIELYEWEYLKIGDYKGLHLQSIFTWKPANWKPIEKPMEENEPKPLEKKNEQKPMKKKEPAPTSEKKEEAKTEPSKPQSEAKQPEQSKQEAPKFPTPQQEDKQKEDKDFFKLPAKEEQPKKKRFF
jgi:hypothetical protein